MVLRPNNNSTSGKGLERQWWFVFRGTENALFSLLLKKPYQHVFVLTRMGNLTIAIDPLIGGGDLIVTEADVAEMLAGFKLNGWVVVHFSHRVNPTKFKLRGPIVSCAGYLAYTIGLSFFGVTPYQLYKKLMRNGGEVI